MHLRVLLIILIPFVSLASPVRSSDGGLGMQFQMDIPDDPPLPDGVIAVEYIESTGQQWIDTGIPYNSFTDEIKCSVEVTEVSQYGAVFGTFETINGTARYFAVRRFTSQNRWQIMAASSKTFGQDSLLLDTRYDICISPPPGYSSINEETFSTGSSQNFVFSLPIYVFAVRNSNNVSGQINSCCRLYSYSHRRDGELLLDLVPVRVDDGDGNPVGCLYDCVSGDLFVNGSKVPFLVGPDL